MLDYWTLATKKYNLTKIKLSFEDSTMFTILVRLKKLQMKTENK